MQIGYKIMIVAGEASGDAHGAKLVRALRAAMPDAGLEFFGAAGEGLRSEGVESIVNSDAMSVVGLPEITGAIPMFLRAFRDLTQAASRRKPDAAILIDFPDFNLKLAKSLKKQGITVIYYISPQLWAWRKYRIRTIRRYVDLLITILPFERAWYAARGVLHVEYVGSPLAREVRPRTSKEEFCSRHSLDPSRPVISLLPGSRHKEITRILPEMLRAAGLISELRGDIQFLIALATIRSETEVRNAFAETETDFPRLAARIKTISGETYDVLNASESAAIASGTATLEAGIIGTPMVIVYKTSSLNYKLLRPLISVEHFGLINLIAGSRVATEMIQDEFTPAALARELLRLLEPEQNQRTRADLLAASAKLGHSGASARAANLIIGLLDRKNHVPK